MRVAVLHSFYSSRQPSGENEVVLSQVSALCDRGHDVALLARYTDAEQAKPAYALRSAFNAMYLGGPDPTVALQAFGPEVIHVHNLFPNWGTSWLKAWGPRVVATLHNFRPVCASGILWRDGKDCTDCLDHDSSHAVKNRCYRDSALATLPLAFATRSHGRHSPVLRNAAAVVTLNHRATDIIVPSTRGRVEVIPNFSESSEAVSTGDGSWLFVGRLSPEKGVLQLIDQMPPEMKLTIIGDGPLRVQVEKAAERSAGYVRYLGPRKHEDVLTAMSHARGLVLPSTWSEGIPTTALEALAVGTPVIVSRYVATAMELTSGDGGVIYDPDVPTSLAVALRTIENDWSSFSRRAREHHRSTFSKARWLSRMESLYRSVAMVSY